MVKRKRYRYIYCGTCKIDDKVSDYRLVSGKGSSCIRIDIPSDLELLYYRGDGYSTTYDDRLIKDLNPQAFLYHNGKWVQDNRLFEWKICDWWMKYDEIKPRDIEKPTEQKEVIDVPKSNVKELSREEKELDEYLELHGREIDAKLKGNKELAKKLRKEINILLGI